MSDCCDWCEKGRDEGWPPKNPSVLCIECLTEWERDVAVGLLLRLWGHECISGAMDLWAGDEGWCSAEFSRDKAAVEAFLEGRKR